MTLIAPFLRLAGELAVSLVAPPRCAACDAAVPLRTVFCASCASTLERASPPDRSVRSAFVYGGALARALERFKYDGQAHLARPLSDLVLLALERDEHAFDVVCPVPLHGSRLIERGFNQSALLASRVASHLRVSFRPLALARIRATSQQASLPREERLKNVANAFIVRQPQAVRGARVLLVDDVRTTGATIGACGEVLQNGGAKDVVSATVAWAKLE